jgi:hypothetical protein
VSTQPPIPSATRPQARAPLAFVALAAAGVLAAGVGGYVAQSHRQTELPGVEARPAQTATPAAKPAQPSSIPAVQPAAPVETTAPAVAPSRTAPSRVEPVERDRTSREAAPRNAQTLPRPAPRVAAAQAPPPSRTPEPAPAVEMPLEALPAIAQAPAPPPAPTAPVEPAARPQASVSVEDTFVLPADSVIGVEIDRTISSETAQVEDRVDARVARDVVLENVVVIPAGARVRGEVVRVERGGRFKERGRIEIAFHSLLLPGSAEPITIETNRVTREGENAAASASARIGGSAAGGAIIGAIFGGRKGAAIGAAAGGAAGSAATAAQKPSEARIRGGAVVTVRLTAPVEITLHE